VNGKFFRSQAGWERHWRKLLQQERRTHENGKPALPLDRLEAFFKRTRLGDRVKDIPGVPKSRCVICTCKPPPRGYPAFQIRGKQLKAHLLYFYVLHRRWPKPGFDGSHLCHRKICILHVIEESRRDNIRRSVRAGLTATGRRHGSKTKPQSVRRGEKNGRAELQEKEVICIRLTAARYNGKPGLMSSLCRVFTKDYKTISEIINRTLWREVEESKFPHVQPLPEHLIYRATRKGESSPFSKLTDVEVREIRILYDHRAKNYGALSILARRYGVGTSTIHRIVTRQVRTEVADNFHELEPLQPLF
jgi:hypothetical protein